METEPIVSFHNVDHSDAVETRIRDEIGKLERFYPRITSCRVAVEAPHRRGHKGTLYKVRIDLGVPGNAIIVDRAGPQNHAHEDVYVAIRDSFAAAQRQLEDHARMQRGDIKHHDVPIHGVVVRLFADEDYGFVELPDGREIYFHRNAVVDDGFDRLTVGSEVRIEYATAESDKGPQASTVRPIGKHHLVDR
jgi:cold shock CspA family protein/ribosome-associated translation inhibitor RaiA